MRWFSMATEQGTATGDASTNEFAARRQSNGFPIELSVVLPLIIAIGLGIAGGWGTWVIPPMLLASAILLVYYTIGPETAFWPPR